MTPGRILLLFIAMAIGGAILEKFISSFYNSLNKKKYRKHHFSFSRYIYLLLMPTVSMLTTVFISGANVLKMFLLFALFGPVLEWLVGYAYQSIVGQKLWTYHRYAITGYTSFLTLPFWGFGGVLFYFLAKSIR